MAKDKDKEVTPEVTETTTRHGYKTEVTDAPAPEVTDAPPPVSEKTAAEMEAGKAALKSVAPSAPAEEPKSKEKE